MGMVNKKLNQWLLPAIAAVGLAANANAEALSCNESIEVAKHCEIEVKCYSDDIVGGAEFYVNFPDIEVEYEFGFEGGEYNICAGVQSVNFVEISKSEIKCTRNASGPDGEENVAVEVSINVAGCPVP